MSELDDKITFSINEDEILNKLQLEYDVFPLLEINEYTLKRQIEMNPYYQQQWRLLYLKEKGLLTRLEIERDEYIGKLYDDLKNRSDTSLTKIEVEKYYIPKDQKVILYKKTILKMETRMQFFEAVYDSFKSQQWLIKNYIETTR